MKGCLLRANIWISRVEISQVPTLEDTMGLNSLYHAASRGHMDLVRFLVLSGAQISFASSGAPCWKRPVLRQNLVFACALMHTEEIKQEARKITQMVEIQLPLELQDMILEYVSLNTWEEALFYLNRVWDHAAFRTNTGRKTHKHTRKPRPSMVHRGLCEKQKNRKPKTSFHCSTSHIFFPCFLRKKTHTPYLTKK